MNISQITNKNNIKSTLFQTLVILLHSLKVLTSKVHSKDVKKANYFRVFCKILSKLCWGHVIGYRLYQMSHSAKIVSAIFYEHALAAILAVSVIHAFWQ